MWPWLTPVLGFFSSKKGPYGVALAAFVLIGYLAYIDIPTVKLVIVAGFAAAVTIVYFLKNKEQTTDSGGTKIYLKFGNKEPILITEEGPMSVVLELTADQQVVYEGFDAFDRNGELITTPLTNPVLSVVTEGAFAIVDRPEGGQALRPLKSGLCQFKVGADPIPEEGGEAGEIFGYFEINALVGKAVTVAPKFGAIEDIPTE